jgi:hypothetical protein
MQVAHCRARTPPSTSRGDATQWVYDRGVSLAAALVMLRDQLTKLGLVVPVAPVRIFEVPRPPVIVDGRAVIRRSRLVDVETYAERFRELQADTRFAWINVSAYGLVDGALVVGIELPEPIVRDPRRGQSLNFSGPPFSVLAASWDAAAGFTIAL